MKKVKTQNFLNSGFLYIIVTALILAGTLSAILIIKKITGYAGVEIPAEAGRITAVLIDDREATSNWAGSFGLVFSQSGFNEEQTATLTSGTISAVTFVFECLDPGKSVNEIYASTNSTIDFSSLKAGTTKMIDDDFLNLSNSTRERANNTFIYNVSISVGSTSISGIPAAYTYVSDAPDNSSFFTGILNESGRLVMVIKVFSTSQTSFKSSLVKYQSLLPIRNSTTKWYFFSDPNDVCPAGFGSGQLGDSNINGYVFLPNSTTPIPNVTVSAGGNSSLTDSNGFYNITTAGGVKYNLVAIKGSYITNITEINTTIGATTIQNLTMSRFFGLLGPNATISGFTKDNSTNLTLANVIISVGGTSTVSNGTGNYSLVISEGTNIIAAVKSGYDNFVGSFSISGGQNLSYIINMSAAIVAVIVPETSNGTLLNNGTIEGFVRDNSTNLSLSNVTVNVAGISNLSDSLGFYNITALSGTTNLVAIKSNYEAYVREVNISINNITFHNFSMSPVAVSSGFGNGTVTGNGTVKGTVKSTSGSILTGVEVSAAGKFSTSNSTGEYLLLQIPAGTHNIVATRTGFNNYFAVINVTPDTTLVKDIVMATTTEAGLGAGSGPGKGSGSGAGKGAGQGPGRGSGTGVATQLEKPTKTVEYEISVKKILKKLQVGNFIGVPITISNFKPESINIKFSIEGDVAKMSKIDKERILIEPGSSGEVTLTLLGNLDPGVYEGNFVITGDINEKIPVYVLLLDKERLSIESLIIKINPLKKTLSAGEELKYTVDLQNLLSEEKYKVSLSYSVVGISSNKSISLDKEEIAIQTSFSLLKSFMIPNDFAVGDYALKVKADFLGISSEHSSIFTVVQPLYKYAVLGFIPLWLLAAIVATLSTGTFSILVYKKKKDEKKRYKIDLDYNQLPKPGPRSAFVGHIAETTNKTYFDLDIFQVHTLVAGSSGSGKSIVAQDLVEEALLKGVAVIVFDPTAQWTGFLRKCEDKKLIGMYKNYGMKKTDSRAFNGNVRQVLNSRELIEFKKFMKPGEINIFVTNKLGTNEIEMFVANTIRQVFHANLPESRELRYLMVYDGIHSLLPKFGGSGQVFVQIERATREFRKWGVGLILISQVLSDFPPEVLANINTEIQLRTRDENDLNRIKEKYGEKILQSVVKAAVGAGVTQNSTYNKGKPYFVSFRPPLHSTQRISDDELSNYNKFNEMTDDLEYQLEQLEKEGIDIFDLKLELKLSQDKIKSGNFNMVNIYLDGLKPRIKSQWDKLGRQPKKREVKYISESDLEEEFNKAKKGQKKNPEEGGKQEINAEKSEKQETEEHKNENDVNDVNKKEGESPLDDIANQIKNLIQNNEKQKAVALYAKIMEIYKNSTKDEKAKILPKCVEIQKMLR